MKEKNSIKHVTKDDKVLKSLLAYARKEAKRFEEEFFQLLRFPSISAETEHALDMQKTAEFTAKLLQEAGLKNAKVMPWKKHPVVLADSATEAGKEAAGKKKTSLLFYGHYDVQPAGDEALWKTPAFSPQLRKGRVYARGANDNKGQYLMHIKAFECFQKVMGGLPFPLKVIIEGEEEIGSPNLLSFVKKHKKKLAADVLLLSDTEMLGKNMPSLTYGLRGIVYEEVEVETGGRDWHSGMYGGVVVNAAEVLVLAFSRLKMADGRVGIPGFYDDVQAPSSKEISLMRSLIQGDASLKKEIYAHGFFYESNIYKKKIGRKGLMAKSKASEKESLFYEKTTTEPLLNLSGIEGGYTGAGSKTVITAKARMKIGIRLVANQDPAKITKLFRAYLRQVIEEIAPKGVKVSFHAAMGGGRPVLAKLDSPAILAASRALEEVYGRPVINIRSGGSIPIVAELIDCFKLTPVLMGFGLKEDAIHSPNESFWLKDFHRGIESSIRFLYYLSKKPLEKN